MAHPWRTGTTARYVTLFSSAIQKYRSLHSARKFARPANRGGAITLYSNRLRTVPSATG